MALSQFIQDKANKRSIHNRPIEVKGKQRIGDWEGDTFVGKERKLSSCLCRKNVWISCG